EKTGNPIQHLQMGPYAKKVSDALKNIVISMLQSGLNVIIDEVCIGDKSFEIWQKKLSGYKVLYVGVNAPIEILEMRENERKDRIIGSARGQFISAHKNNQYDLEIDTSRISIENCVSTIMKKIG
ncbi:MAG TPA: chloramphenicol phosphotransferase, partial [Gammaproteobacteria bacterium]|nr:chloramphenicol phosphotransferase [Gammaproteobacteria bacterium]